MNARTAKLDLRLTPEAKQTLTAAAQAANRSVSEFVLDSALARAQEELLDRRMFVLDDARWEAFNQALDAAPRDNPRLRALMQMKAPWET